MPDLDSVHDAVERLEWADSKQEETSESRRWALTRRTALTGGAAGIAAFMIEACGGGSSSSSAASTRRLRLASFSTSSRSSTT